MPDSACCEVIIRQTGASVRAVELEIPELQVFFLADSSDVCEQVYEGERTIARLIVDNREFGQRRYGQWLPSRDDVRVAKVNAALGEHAQPGGFEPTGSRYRRLTTGEVVDQEFVVELSQLLRGANEIDMGNGQRACMQQFHAKNVPSLQVRQQELKHGFHVRFLGGILEGGVVPSQDKDVEGLIARPEEIFMDPLEGCRVSSHPDDEVRPEGRYRRHGYAPGQREEGGQQFWEGDHSRPVDAVPPLKDGAPRI